MKKIAISVRRIAGDTAHFMIPANLDALEVRGIVDGVMEQLMLDDQRIKLNKIDAVMVVDADTR